VVDPLYTADAISAEIVSALRERVRSANGDDGTMPVWVPWPLPSGWTMTGAAWAGDDRTGVRATGVALTGPAPLQDGPADMVVVAEEPGVGLGAGLAGVPGPDLGPALSPVVESSPADAKVRVGAHPSPLWAVPSAPDRSAYVGAARGRWLSVITWPASAGYLLAEELVLADLVDELPAGLVCGAPSWRLRPIAHGG